MRTTLHLEHLSQANHLVDKRARLLGKLDACRAETPVISLCGSYLDAKLSDAARPAIENALITAIVGVEAELRIIGVSCPDGTAPKRKADQ